MLHQLLYVSAEKHPPTKDDLLALLKESREKNAQLGITGILLYYKRYFFQVLEGEKKAVFDLFQIIRKEERHFSVILVFDQPVEERSFSEWTMAFVNINEIEKSKLEGFSDFLEKGFHTEITPQHLTIAQKLLIEFKSTL